MRPTALSPGMPVTAALTPPRSTTRRSRTSTCSRSPTRRTPSFLQRPSCPGVTVNAHGNLKTSHDFDVLQLPDGSWHLMVSDWDAGWINVDVTDPESPVIVGDFDYAACDQLMPTGVLPRATLTRASGTATEVCSSARTRTSTHIAPAT